MRILLVAATIVEIKSFTSRSVEVGKPCEVVLCDNHSVDILVTGVGAVPTAFFMARFAGNYNFVVNIGIAGSYNRNIKIGQVVAVRQDAFGDYGIDNNGVFESLMHAGLLDKKSIIQSDVMVNPWIARINIDGIPEVNGVTLGTASGSIETIGKIKDVWDPDIETMESAAVFYSCLYLGIPFIGVRAISNMVEPRNKKGWNINSALSNLHSSVLALIRNIDTFN